MIARDNYLVRRRSTRQPLSKVCQESFARGGALEPASEQNISAVHQNVAGGNGKDLLPGMEMNGGYLWLGWLRVTDTFPAIAEVRGQRSAWRC